WPTRIARESPRRANGSAVVSGVTRMTARSVCGSRPITSATNERPSVSVTRGRSLRSTTCAFVRIRPSGVKMTPEPPPRSISILTTAGPTASTALVTAQEYASSRSSSRTDCGFTHPSSRPEDVRGSPERVADAGSKRSRPTVVAQPLRLLPPRTADDAACRGAGVIAVLEHLRAVDPDVADADRILMGFVVCRAIRDRVRVEDDDVGELACGKAPTIFDLQRVGRQRRQLSNRFFERDDVLVAHVLAEQPREVAVRARVRSRLEEHPLRGHE